MIGGRDVIFALCKWSEVATEERIVSDWRLAAKHHE